MTIIDPSLLITTIMFGCYGLACSLEGGIALRLFFAGDAKTRGLFTPFWELTNVFLVFGFTAFSVLFNNALSTVSQAVLSTLAVALVALLLRACLVLMIFYLRDGEFSRGWAGLFALLNFAIPLSFTAAGAYFLTGQPFWQTYLGWAIVTTAWLGITAIGLLFINRRQSSKAITLSELVMLIWLLGLGSGLPLLIQHSNTSLQEWPIVILIGLSFGGLMLAAYKMVVRAKFSLWPYAALTGFAAPLLLALANRPYLINGKMTLQQAFGASSYASVVVAGLFIMLPLILAGFWIFSRLYGPATK